MRVLGPVPTQTYAKSKEWHPFLRRPAGVPSEGLQRGVNDVSTEPADRQAAYRDLRDRAKRYERGREENFKRLVELHRERHLHAFPIRDSALSPAALD